MGYKFKMFIFILYIISNRKISKIIYFINKLCIRMNIKLNGIAVECTTT